MCGNKKIRPTTVRRNWVQGQALNCKVYVQTCLSGTEFGQQKAMTGNARHGEHQTPPSVSYLWAGAKKSATINDSGIRCRGTPLLAEMERLNIPLHTTFYCFIKLLVNHAFTSFKPFHLFHISQAYIYNSALSCIIRVRKTSSIEMYHLC